MRTLIFFCVLGLVATVLARSAWSASGAAMLTVATGETETVLTRGDLDSLRIATVRTETRGTEGPSVFRGPLMRDVLALANAAPNRDSIIAAKGADDYTATIPATDIETHDVILATEKDGRRLKARNNGPLWIIYPGDHDAGADKGSLSERSVWRLVSLTVR